MPVYISIPSTVDARFADAPETVRTLEGDVTASAGDAIASRGGGDTWPVPRKRFDATYLPKDGQAMGERGRYEKLRAPTRAERLSAPLEVPLSDKRGTLRGEAGDWLVWHDASHSAIVSATVFPKSYEPFAVPVYVGSADAAARLKPHLPFTEVLVPANVEEAGKRGALTLQVVEALRAGDAPRLSAMELDGVVESLDTLRLGASWPRYTWNSLLNLLATTRDSIEKTETGKAQAHAVGLQLFEIDRFNQQLSKSKIDPDNELRSPPFRPAGSAESSDLRRLRLLRCCADDNASNHQARWQNTVFATTRQIADAPKQAGGQRNEPKDKHATYLDLARLLFSHPSLGSFGLLAAVSLAFGSELAGLFPIRVHLGLIFFCIYIGALGALWWLYARAKAESWEAQHQDARLLAELLRAAYVRRVLGAEAAEPGTSVPDRASSGVDWVERALAATLMQSKAELSPSAASSAAGSVDLASRVAWAETQFIDEQANYHRKTLGDNRRAAHRNLAVLASRSLLVFLCATAIAVVALLAQVWGGDGRWFGGVAEHIGVFLMVCSLAMWGLARRVSEEFAWEQEVRRGEWVLAELERAQAQNRSAVDLVSIEARKKAVFAALAVFENDQTQWHALHRSRPISTGIG